MDFLPRKQLLSFVAATLFLHCSPVVRTPDAQRVFEDVAPRRDTALFEAATDASVFPDQTPPTMDASSAALGATVEEGGVRFRVWAPGANRAFVQGDFGQQEMTAEDGGVRSAFVSGVQPGSTYRYTFERGGQTLQRVDPRGVELRNGMSVVGMEPYAWRDTAFTPPPLRQTVLYELHIGSFSVATGARGGTFADATARLDELADLGINAIQLMPIHFFNSATRWGYNPQQYFALNSAYGTPSDARRFVDEAHRRGIAVVLDLVYNHYDGARSAPLRCFDGDCEDGSAGLYFFRTAPYAATPWGPRPDFANAQVRSYLLDGIEHWIRNYHVDGFRWDSLSNIRGIDGMGTVPGGRELIVAGVQQTRSLRPGALLIAEDLKGLAAVTQSPQSGGFGFDTQWDGFVYVMGEQLAGSDDNARDMNAIRGAILGGYNGDPLQRIVGTENHDTVGNNGLRFPQRVDAQDPGSWAARKRSMLAAALAFTVPGVPMLFMGQELLETGTFAPEPRPIDWARAQAHARIRAFYRTLLRLRRNLDGVSPGLLGSGVEVLHFSDSNKVLTFRRWSNRGIDDVMVLANFRNRRYTRYDIGVPAAGSWQVRLDTDDPQWSTDFGGTAPMVLQTTTQTYDGLPYRVSVPLGPWSIVVLTRVGP